MTTQHPVTFTWQTPRDVTLTIDGTDIARSTRHVTLDVDAGGIPRLVLELDVIEIPAIDLAAAHISVGPETADLLCRLGWTPPPLPAASHGLHATDGTPVATSPVTPGQPITIDIP